MAVQSVIVLGGGSAGFLAAIALKVKMPDLPVRVVRSKDLGIIGVGEGSTIGFTHFLHRYLRVGHKRFFEVAQPTWKMGLRFLWGPRPYFNYDFVNGQVDGRVAGLPKPKAFYCDDQMEYEDPVSAMMSHDRVFGRMPNGGASIPSTLAYHFENEKFVRFLEGYAAAAGVTAVDDTVLEVRQDDGGVAGLVMASGQAASADLYIDASGFRSELLGKAMAEPFRPYARSLFCNRAVVGGWDRHGPADEVIKPYTTCETMSAGWCWQIEHETRINRGYVYCPDFITDEAAEAEFRAVNPNVGPTRVVKFISGRYERAWVKNVVGIGNASGFVEPLEATALGVIGLQCIALADSLVDADRDVRPFHRAVYNRHFGGYWDDIQGFLAIHYRFNTRSDSPFWRHCRAETDLAGAAGIVEAYRECGPSPLWMSALVGPTNQFGTSGYATLLVGQKVPHQRRYAPTEQEIKQWESVRRKHKDAAVRGFTVREALATVRSPKWRWPDV